jgi:hypothetical protein
MSTERKVCCYCTREGPRAHACPNPRGPYLFPQITQTPQTPKPAKAALEAK